MSDKITKDDIFDPSIIDVLTKIKEGLESVINAKKELINLSKVNSSDDIKNLKSLLSESERATIALVKAKEALAKAETESTKAAIDNSKLNAQINKELEAESKLRAQKNKELESEIRAQNTLNKAIEQETKAKQKAEQQAKKDEEQTKKAASAYVQLNESLKENRKRLQDILAENRDLSDSEKQLLKDTQNLDKQLKDIDAQLGLNQRNVGNYKSGFDGLGNAINQIGRELPAFSNSIQTGLSGISNNLGPLVDEITKLNKANEVLKANGEPTKSVFSQIGAAVFSFNSLINIGITLLTVFGAKLFEALSGNDDEFKKAIANLKQTNRELEISIRIAQLQGKITKAELQSVLGLISENEAEKTKILREGEIKRIELINEFQQKRKDLVETGLEEARKLQQRANLESVVPFLNNLAVEDSKKAARLLEVGNQEKLNLEIKLKEDLIKLEADQAIRLANLNKKIKEDAKKDREKDLSDKKTEKDNEFNAEKLRLDNLLRIEKEKVLNQFIFEEITREQANELFLKIEEDFLIKEIKLFEKYGKDTTSLLNKEQDLRLNKAETTRKKEESAIKEAVNNALKGIEDQKKAEEDLQKFRDAEEEFAAKQRAERLKKEREEIKRNFDLVIQTISQALQERNKLTNDALNRDIDQRQRNIQTQQDLAARGLNNQLAFEKSALAKQELQRKEELKRQQNQEENIKLATLFINNLNGKLDKGKDYGTASIEALAETFAAKGLAALVKGSFFDGTENTGDGGNFDRLGGMLTITHPNERIMSAADNERTIKNGHHLSNKELSYIASDYLNGRLIPVSFSDVQAKEPKKESNYAQLQQMIITNRLLEEIANKPTTSINLDNLGNVISTKIERGIVSKTKIVDRI